MFDIAPTELLLIVIVAVVVIGPKDLPLAMRAVGRWVGKIRKVSNHFRAGLDAMVREAEMAELEKQWQEQNLKIIRDHPADAPPEMEPTGAYPARPMSPAAQAASADASPPADAPMPTEAPAPVSAEARAVPADDAAKPD